MPKTAIGRPQKLCAQEEQLILGTGRALNSARNPKLEEIRREIYCQATYAAGRCQLKIHFLPNSATVILHSQGYKYLQEASQKSLLTDKDRKNRLEMIKHEIKRKMITKDQT